VLGDRILTFSYFIPTMVGLLNAVFWIEPRRALVRTLALT
jgi:hypothetical protein